MSPTPLSGFHAIEALLHRHPQRVLELFYDQKRHDARLQHLLQCATSQGIAIQAVDSRVLDQKASVRHQGVVAMCLPQEPGSLKALFRLLDQQTTDPFLLVLDSVQDPHNLGAICRTAEAVGVTALIVPKDRAAPFNETARRISCGASELLPLFVVTNVASCLKELQQRGIWCLGASSQGKADLYQQSLTGPLAWVMGAEGTGLRPLVAKHCDILTKIPLIGATASLNVSVAAGICLFESLRQRQV